VRIHPLHNPALMPWLIMLLACFLACAPASRAQGMSINLDESVSWRNVTAQTSYLLDPDASKSVDGVAAMKPEEFATPKGNAYNFGVAPGVVWIRLDIRNPTERHAWVLELNNPRLEEVRVYMPNPEDGWEESAVGTDHPVAERLALHVLPAVRIVVPAHEDRVAYLRVKHSGSMRFQVQLSTTQRFRQQVTNRTAATAALAGGLLVMFLFNIIVLIQLRELSYLYLAGAVLSFLAFTMALNGSGYLWIWPDAHWWSGRSVTTCAMLHFTFICLFFYEFLRPAPGAERIRKLALGLAVLFVGLTLIALTDWWGKYYLVGGIGMLGPLIIQAAAVRIWLKGYRPALQFVIAWFFGVVGGLYFTGINVGAIEHSYVGETAISIGYLMSVVFWNLSLAERLRVSEAATREQLEAEVASRTRELTQALDEVRTLSGLLPICSTCNKIRDDQGYWQGVEQYLHAHTGAQLSHGMCPDCMSKLYPDLASRVVALERELEEPKQ